MLRSGVRAALRQQSRALVRNESTTTKAAEAAKDTASKAQDAAQKAQEQAKALGAKATAFVGSASSQASGLVGKVLSFKDPVIYWGKVGGEIAKQVYTKEKMSPPNVAEAQSAVQNVLVQLRNPETFKNASQQDYIKWVVYAIELMGFFAVGEMIGRRNMVGYDVPGLKEEHHH
ncbi:ATP synthase subunit G atp20 [Saitoella coloradoensis]